MLLGVGIEQWERLFLFFFIMPGVEPRVLNILCKCSTTELYFKIFKHFFRGMCARVGVYLCLSAHVEVKGQLAAVGSLLLLCAS